MPIGLEQWRMQIGALEAQRYRYLSRASRKAARGGRVRVGRISGGCLVGIVLCVTLLCLATSFSMRLLLAGDVERNPGPLPDEILSAVDSSELAVDDLRDVYKEVYTLAGRWKAVCLFLGLSPSEMEITAATYPNNPCDCFREMLLKWLQKAYNFQRYGSPTWKMLVEAVADPAGGNNTALAEKIAKAHQGMLTGTSPHEQNPLEQPTSPITQSTSSNCPPPKRQKMDPNLTRATTSQDLDSPMDTYAAYLKSVYTQHKMFVYDKWPNVKSKRYINLALIDMEEVSRKEADEFTRATIHGNIDDIKCKKKAIELQEIGQLPDGSRPKCILVEGAPGMGKSTFSLKLCRKWGKGKILQQYKLLVLLKLREKRVREAKRVSDLFHYPSDPKVQQIVARQILRSQGKEVLVFFEGYDELPAKLRTEDSIFLQVIKGELLPEATVLITSRPVASEYLLTECEEHISKRIEILGFTQENIQSYLESTTGDDPSLLSGLQQYLSCYPHIRSMVYNPLNCAIVVKVYKSSREDNSTIPKTMTELYSSLIRSLLLRYLREHYKEQGWRIRSFSDLPPDVHKQLFELGRIAYEGIANDQQVIFSDLPEDFETLDLMQCVPELYVDEGAVLLYNFLHLTIQEYMAAFYLSQQPVTTQVEYFRKYTDPSGNDMNDSSFSADSSQGSDEQLARTHTTESLIESLNSTKNGHLQLPRFSHVQMVLRFLAGLSKFTGYPPSAMTSLIQSDEGYATMEVLHWMFEAQGFEASFCSPVRFKALYGLSAHFDWFVLGYCISHMSCSWELEFQYHICDEEMDMLVEGATEKTTNLMGTGVISKLNISNTTVTSTCLKSMQRMPEVVIRNLEVLQLERCELGSEEYTVLAELLPSLPMLKSLSLKYNGNGGVTPVIKALLHLTSISDLEMSGIGVEDCQALSKLLSMSTSLEVLNISYCGDDSENDRGDDSENDSGDDSENDGGDNSENDPGDNSENESDDARRNEFLDDSTTESELNKSFSENRLSPDGVKLIIAGLKRSTSLRELYMFRSDFSSQNVVSLASALKTNRTLLTLDISDCNIQPDGACSLAESLCVNTSLEELDLNFNIIGDKGATAFANKALIKNNSLRILKLKDDSISLEVTKKLIDALAVYPALRLGLSHKHKSSLQYCTPPEVYCRIE